MLLIYIDDARSRILDGEFVALEDTLSLLRTTKTYLQQHGRPVAFYVDKDSIYRVNRQATIEEQLQDMAPLTQFTRSMRELNIDVICAHNPIARHGRIPGRIPLITRCTDAKPPRTLQRGYSDSSLGDDRRFWSLSEAKNATTPSAQRPLCTSS